MKKKVTFYEMFTYDLAPNIHETHWKDTSILPSIQEYALRMYAYGISRMEPGSELTPSVHQPYVVVWFGTAGTGLIKRKGGSAAAFSAGDMCICGKTEYTVTLPADAGEPLVRNYIMIHNGVLAGLLGDIGILAESGVVRLSEPERVGRICEKIERRLREQNEYCIQEVSTLCYALLTELARQVEQRRESSDFNRVVFLISRLPNKKYTLGNLAKTCGISVRTLNNLFRRFQNCSPIEFVIRKRMNLAQYLLHVDQTLSVGAVAKLSGYSNIPFFNREFKKRFGLTPNAWRIAARDGKVPEPVRVRRY